MSVASRESAHLTGLGINYPEVHALDALVLDRRNDAAIVRQPIEQRRIVARQDGRDAYGRGAARRWKRSITLDLGPRSARISQTANFDPSGEYRGKASCSFCVANSSFV